MDTILLKNLWNRILNSTNDSINKSTWEEEIAHLYKLGISMETTLQYLHNERPSLKIFNNWVITHTKLVANGPAVIANVLSNEDLMFWENNGYIVIRDVISKEDCHETQEAIWEFLGKKPNEKSSWYEIHPAQKGLMVNFSNHPTLEKNRASLKIQKAYEQLYQTNKIYKTIDKVSFNPPVTREYSFLGSALHWDVSLRLPIPFRLQGLLYLSDCDENDGAFHCVPGFHNQITTWMDSISPEQNPREVALQTLIPKPVTGKAGDFVIWHQALPHCATPNHGKFPRMVQYLSYFPEQYEAKEEWI